MTIVAAQLVAVLGQRLEPRDSELQEVGTLIADGQIKLPNDIRQLLYDAETARAVTLDQVKQRFKRQGQAVDQLSNRNNPFSTSNRCYNSTPSIK